jgi:glycosyltransferase involved in cell wall biosynthesis
MKKKIAELSVFFPAYNEEDNIQKTVTAAQRILPRVAKKWEIIIINDGSTDKTSKIVGELIKREPRVRMITHTPNRGYGAALKSGFYNARYSLIAFTDADGQFKFSEITKFLATQKRTNADLVIGYYLKRKVPWTRLLGSKFFWQPAVYLLFGLRVRDINCAFKLIKKGVIDKIPRLEAERGPFISSELLIKARRAGFKIVEIGVHHYPRRAGHATGADLKVVLSGLADLWRLRLKLKKK